MSRNGSGTYTLPAGNPVVTGTTISSTWANSTLTNIASALTDSLAADGQTTATGNLKMGNNRITGLANGIAATDAASITQVTSAVAITGGTIGGVTFAAGSVSAPAIAPTGDTNTGIFFPSADTIAFSEGGAEAMRINPSGDLLVGTTSSGGTGVTISGTIGNNFWVSNTNTTNAYTQLVFLNPNGTVGSISTSGSLTAYNVSSDRRLKENIVPLTTGLTSVLSLRPSQYNYKADPTTSIQGFIADELQQVVPHAVSGEANAVDKDGKPVYQGVDASFLIPFLVSAIQELKATVDAQAARIAALEA